MEFKLDLYFQHHVGQTLHPNLDTVVKMILGDIKISALPIPKVKPFFYEVKKRIGAIILRGLKISLSRN